VGHDTELGTPVASMTVGADQVEPLKSHPCPTPPTATQLEVVVEDTDVSQLDAGSPLVAPALATIVSVRAKTNPAITRPAPSARPRRVRDRDTRCLPGSSLTCIWSPRLAPFPRVDGTRRRRHL
jgi:hypothetical protein